MSDKSEMLGLILTPLCPCACHIHSPPHEMGIKNETCPCHPFNQMTSQEGFFDDEESES